MPRPALPQRCRGFSCAVWAEACKTKLDVYTGPRPASSRIAAPLSSKLFSKTRRSPKANPMAKCRMCDGPGLMGFPLVRCLYCEGTGKLRRVSVFGRLPAYYWIATVMLIGAVLSLWSYGRHRDALEK